MRWSAAFRTEDEGATENSPVCTPPAPRTTERQGMVKIRRSASLRVPEGRFLHSTTPGRRHGTQESTRARRRYHPHARYRDGHGCGRRGRVDLRLRRWRPRRRRSGPGAASVAAAKPEVVTRTRDVYDTYVVAGTGDDRSSEARSAGSAPTTPSAKGAPSEAEPAAVSVVQPIAGVDSAPTTTALVPPTTLAPQGPSTTIVSMTPTTPTTRPPGVPHDWPAGKPIPPMPPNCRDPQLEDNGVWNCDH